MSLKIESHREDGVAVFHANSRESWRTWLEENHEQAQSVWLLMFHKKSDIPSVYYDEAVDEALCFGWIDSKPNKRDQQSYYQYFSARNPKSNWSRVNKEKVNRLISEGRFTAAGEAMVSLAKSSGTWDALNEVEALIVPEDLQAEFGKYSEAEAHFSKFPPSARRAILEWIFNAKRAPTRQKRIEETAKLAQDNIRANQYTPKK